MKFWQFKVPMNQWAKYYKDEYEELKVGNIFVQEISKNRNQLGNNIGHIVFYYNSKKSKKYPIGIYLVCEIVSKVNKNNLIELKVLKDLRDNPYNYSTDFTKIFTYYNTTKIRKRTQGKEVIIDMYKPRELYKKVMNLNEFSIPEEINKKDELDIYEGAKIRIIVNAYERNRKAREECIEHYGTTCYICGFNFEKKYGDIGKDFIHVHHIKELSEIKKEYKVDPIKDLIPVCPNCHAMLHKKNPAYKIDAIKSLIKKANKK